MIKIELNLAFLILILALIFNFKLGLIIAFGFLLLGAI